MLSTNIKTLEIKKVTVEYQEVKVFTNTMEIEMTEKQYQQYCKTGKLTEKLISVEEDLQDATGDEHFDYTERAGIISII